MCEGDFAVFAAGNFALIILLPASSTMTLTGPLYRGLNREILIIRDPGRIHTLGIGII
jgi:hypothetical protein